MTTAVQIIVLQEIKKKVLPDGKVKISIEEVRFYLDDLSSLSEEKEGIEGVDAKFTRITRRSNKPDIVVIGSPAAIEAKIVFPNKRILKD